jgi:hypothetical protein
MFTNAKYSESPKDFILEKWIEQQDENVCPHSVKQPQPFAHLPFGFDVRVCFRSESLKWKLKIFCTASLDAFELNGIKKTQRRSSFP